MIGCIRKDNEQMPLARLIGDAEQFSVIERVRAIIRQEAAALETLANRVDEHICTIADHILSSTGIVVVCGIGKSRLVGEKISATLASTGTPSITLDPVDALHGDLGRVRPGDIILAISNSGETAELIQLIRSVRRLSVVVAAMTGSATSSLAQAADVVLDIGQMQEACALGLAPTTSMMAMAAMGDALALILQERRGFTRQDFARLHPSGSLGHQLMRVRDVMCPLGSIPVIGPDTPLSLALLSMCCASRKLGVAAIVGEQCKVVGILIGESIGRLVERGATLDLNDPVKQHMQQPHTTISEHASLGQAAQLFRQHEIELVPVHDDQERVIGLISRQNVQKLV
ncbi:KpsF/GutQ family sugar-phosphate isomerase [Mesorhizobium sp.]|uniref:KpsF/GutQ family sugar-phosphate isomerase n=1 Tax=Mesorhizobium sp. TaxID=1871066 RepID=UPI000FEA9F0D|nr:KpsF/GutQ family sugar-phosphate isomerase [Mesorhizobium sp.]RWF29304.1 MAG: KpsF/GutQ family sugar-phosphate isomerase [Mesorhizobium sp.]